MSPTNPEPLRFPRGVRFARSDELPHLDGTSVGPPPVITTGYCVLPGKEGAYAAVIEANVHAQNLWATFRVLAERLLPAVAAPIVGIKDEEPVLGPYTERRAALAVFEPFVEYLEHDGFLEFGMIFQCEEKTEEVFVRSYKYLRVWTNQPETARNVLEDLGVPHVAELTFIDDYCPRVSETLRLADGSAGWAMVVDRLKEAFEALPEPQDIEEC